MGTTVKRFWLCGLLLLAAWACDEESLPEFLRHYTPHERYEQALREAGLGGTALGRDWIAAASQALDAAITVAPPYREESYLDPRETMATAYRMSLRRGQRLEVAFESEPDGRYRVFIDLFLTRGSDLEPMRIASADSLARELDYLARRDGDYVIRVQPELLRGGRYSISIVVAPSLQFPVAGHDSRAIGSWYGDARDGGRRRHEGLDIFARRGTPVLAAADGYVRGTRRTRLGGNVVWLRDDLGRFHYYAHLDTQTVRRGERVQAGDTVGFVGNTGNARRTPPHLHFGLYARGSFDPYPALQPLPSEPAPFRGDSASIGRLVRVNRAAARIRSQPTMRSATLAELPLHTTLQVKAGTGAWYRVTTPEGTIGFIAARLTEPLDGPVRRQVVSSGTILLTEPTPAAVAVEAVTAGTELPVLGTYGEFLYVEGPSGKPRWMPAN